MSGLIRLAAENDSDRILEIYGPYVKNTAISFENEVPSGIEYRNRIITTLKQLPWLVFEVNGMIQGYAYASEHRKRAAYRWSVDLSIYVAPEFHRNGIARALYGCLTELLKLQGYFRAYAGVTIPNEKSEAFHESFGFKPIGIYNNVGYKLGKWHNTKWFEYIINDSQGEPKETKTIKDIKATKEFSDIIKKYSEEF